MTVGRQVNGLKLTAEIRVLPLPFLLSNCNLLSASHLMDVDAPAPPSTPERCPHLLSVYVKPGAFHNSFLFKETSSLPTQDVYQLYVWEETTIRELVQGLVGIVPDRMRNCQGSWAFRSV